VESILTQRGQPSLRNKPLEACSETAFSSEGFRLTRLSVGRELLVAVAVTGPKHLCETIAWYRRHHIPDGTALSEFRRHCISRIEI